MQMMVSQNSDSRGSCQRETSSIDINNAKTSYTVQEELSTRCPKQRKKSVHFADTKGLALTSTFFFASDNFSLQDYHTRIIAYFNKKNRRADGQCAKLLNFKSPVSSANGFKESLRMQNVCLEETVCNEFGICGRVLVQNLAVKKDVFVRYTFDSWETSHDEYANYIPDSNTGTTDTFFFQIKPPQTSEDKKMEFAVCYKVNEGEFWDNNHGDNFRLIYLHSKDKLDLRINTDLKAL